MTKRMLIMLGCVVVIIAALAFGFFLHIKQLMANAPKPTPQTVTAAVVSALEWQPQLASVGTVTAAQGVDISSEVAGQVRSVNFKSGQAVNAGDVLVQLNADSDMAQLAALQAAAELAAVTLKRDEGQLSVQAVSQAQVDGDRADLKSKTALVAQQQAQVAKKTIHAPFSGRLAAEFRRRFLLSGIPPSRFRPGSRAPPLQSLFSLLPSRRDSDPRETPGKDAGFPGTCQNH